MGNCVSNDNGTRRLPRILLADDETAITSELAPLLERSGFEVCVAHDGNEALRLVQVERPDLAVLDVLMPGCDGREIGRRMRARGDTTPIILLTQVGLAGERAMALEEGADDYLNKPFEPAELVARIRAVLRRMQPGAAQLGSARRLISGRLVLDRPARRILLDGIETALTGKAFALLEELMLMRGEVVSRERLLDDVWGFDYPVATRAVDVRVAELRRVLGDDADAPQFVETVVGTGYRFVGTSCHHVRPGYADCRNGQYSYLGDRRVADHSREFRISATNPRCDQSPRRSGKRHPPGLHQLLDSACERHARSAG